MSPRRRTSADGRFQRVSPADRRGLRHGRWIAVGAMSLFLVLVAIFGSGGWLVSHREARVVDRLSDQLQEVQGERAEVQDRTSDLLEPGGFELERVARERYLMRAEDDQVIHLVPAKEAGSAGDSEGSTGGS